MNDKVQTGFPEEIVGAPGTEGTIRPCSSLANPGEMNTNENVDRAYAQMVERSGYDFGLKRRSFMQLLGAGLLLTGAAPGLAQRSGRRGLRGAGARPPCGPAPP